MITGTGGLGYYCAEAMAQAGAQIIIGGRNEGKGNTAVDEIKKKCSSADVKFELLDLSSLDSVSEFSMNVMKHFDSLDILINNAGIMLTPLRKETVDGFELQMATNYFGHFALTAHMLPLLKQGYKSRVITVSSVAARTGTIELDDLNSEKHYDAMEVYRQSKLACLMFSRQLNRLSQKRRWGIGSIAAHPGLSRTNLLHNGPGRNSIYSIARSCLGPLLQHPRQGILPLLYAATSADAKLGSYYGPSRWGETRGYPGFATLPKAAEQQNIVSSLWEKSELLTRVCFD